MNQQLAFYRIKGSKLCEITDREHIQIRRELEDLRKAIAENADSEKILEISTDLILTLLLHFQSEEQAMGNTSHPTLIRHLQLHAEMIESLRGIAVELQHRHLEAAVELLKLFDGQLNYHMEVEDAEMERVLAN